MAKRGNVADSLLALATQTARVQIAAADASVGFWAGWMDLSSQFSAVAAREVLSVGTGADIGDVIDHLAEATGDFVTKSTLLPRAAVLRFENTLAPKRDRKRPRRPQRAK